MRHFISIAFVCLLLLSACMELVEEQINHQIPLTEQKLGQLHRALNQGEVANASLLIDYAKQLSAKLPEQQKLIAQIAKNATPQGLLYQSLKQRFQAANYQAEMFANQELRYQELLDIYQAADPDLFSDALSDPLNVLAAMSEGELARVNAQTKRDTLQINHAQDFGAAATLIGHPAFGRWQSDQNGAFVWQWLKRARTLNALTREPPITYRHWAENRDYSYYADVGRSRFTSIFLQAKQQKIDNKLGSIGAFAQQRQGDRDLSAASLVLKSTYD
ncbi:hypothetical protein [Thalassotalea litorea]|uniref:hypothetical protein n=1 Tax=Thalassotalea litorea TaxID=2020715 RepID=UPI0037365F71